MQEPTARFQARLHAVPHGIPDDFSVVSAHQLIPHKVLQEVDRFIEVFERVTTRPAWQRTVLKKAPDTAQMQRSEVCFFSAWDIHLPPEQTANWQLIEFNDNGSGFLFAAQINRVYFDQYLSAEHHAIEAPPSYSQLCRQIRDMIAEETTRFFGRQPGGTFFILDDAESLQTGKFRTEHQLLADIAQSQGWQTAIGSPDMLTWGENQLSLEGQPVTFIVNRCTDFLWQDKIFAPLIEAYRASRVYVAPNPFTYATRSDKQLLQFLSCPDRDEKLGIQASERAFLACHVPPSYQVTKENLDQLAARKAELVFKPCHGHAGLGIMDSSEVGRHRLQRLLAQGRCYMAQQIAEKSCLMLTEDLPLWGDLRVWAYRGKRYLISGRASRLKERLDLRPPGGWIPTFTAQQ
ncbi:MAG: hypothetical protein V7731_02630 [Amphritea sp.]